MIKKELIELKPGETLDEDQIAKARKINDFTGYEKVFNLFPNYKFDKGLELFSGQGLITVYLHTKVRRLTCIDIVPELKDCVWRFKNVTFIPVDSLALVRRHWNQIAYDVVDIDCSTNWDGEGLRRYEFYCFLPEVLKMVRKFIVFTFIKDPFSEGFRSCLNKYPGYNENLIDYIAEARSAFWGVSGFVTDEVMEEKMNAAANKVGKKVKLLLREPRTPLMDAHERIYFLVENV